MANGDANQEFLKSTAAAMRAVAGGVDHQVSYAGTDTHVGKAEVRLPALPPRATAVLGDCYESPTGRILHVPYSRTVVQSYSRIVV